MWRRFHLGGAFRSRFHGSSPPSDLLHDFAMVRSGCDGVSCVTLKFCMALLDFGLHRSGIASCVSAIGADELLILISFRSCCNSS